ncbi:MAG TPA: hypothetical protein VK923_00530 [Euzebyales bacterium]|nr:hypothetical protein [Euzebyales bacterium]
MAGSQCMPASREGTMMASQTQRSAAAPRDDATSGWAIGFISFAAIIMIMSGVFQTLAGLVAVFENEFYVATPNYLFQFDATTWGWIHLILGLVVLAAGFGMLSGQTWARVVGITLAVLSAIANFLFIPYYPFWSLLIIVLDVMVIWALAAHGDVMRSDAY